MKRYDSYKASGVQWLGEIPSHWEMKRWRFLMVENTKKNSDSRVRRQLQFRYGDIVRKANQSEESDVLDTISKYIVVEPNDIMINGLNLNYDFVSQRVAQVKEEGAITSAYISLRPTNIACSRYYTYFLKSMDSKKMFHGMGTGIRLTLSYNELKNHFIPRPSIEEQDAIANYLDNITSKIDEAIAQQQKMIDLLNERKQIIINNAVTKGLNPNVKMKDSGVEWIGEIPEHWEVVPMKYCVQIKNGMDYKHIQTESGIPVIGSGGQFAYASDYMYDGEVVFFGRKGTVDRPLYFNGKFWAVDTMFYTIPNNKILGKYLYYQGLTIPYKYYSTSTALPSMTQSDLGNNPICLPTINEQNEIVNYLDAKCKKNDHAITNCDRQIALLQERKQIIINEVVTGKVKVS